MKALIYGLIALAAISCAALQPEQSTLLEDSAVRIAHGEPVLVLEDESAPADPTPQPEP